ncbi:hypothetical protein FHR92_003015 [Fontibacillus solani]|uniref:Uncharacterized protein n=1 Tax=Fontibacillus solani TaxID=1572857 RepID=A0A7W3XSA6_9BACL|nr:hypothetical protein [Fontibacillus solani]MBA9086537.1 hypothetical protein [Fontibacillus solani]
MVRSREEARAELWLLFQKKEQERIELDDVLLEFEGNVLVRKTLLLRIGDNQFWGESFEIWTDVSKYESRLEGEEGYIYCTHYAGSSEEAMIQTFKQRFGTI